MTFSSILAQLNHLLQGPNNFAVPGRDVQFTDNAGTTHDEINVLDDLIIQLRSRRAVLLRRTNFEQSHICRLPSELLAEIFQLADAIDKTAGCSPSKRRHPLTPMRLGAVCSHWREVAWSSPQLWTQMPLTGCWAWQHNFPIAATFRTYFQNLKATSLKLLVNCFRGGPLDSSDGEADGIPHEDAFNTVFVENAGKLRAMDFSMWPRPWLPHIARVQQTIAFSNLEEVRMRSIFDSLDTTFSITNAPRLRSVELTGVLGSATINLPWNGITHLNLSQVSSDICLKLFVQCSNLTSFSCRDLSSSSTSVSNEIKKPVTFEHLKEFHYLDCEVTRPWRDVMGQYLTFSSLESVIWRPDWSGNVDWQLLCGNPDSIKGLEFRMRRRDKRRLKNMLFPLVYLEELKISSWPSIKLSLLELLTPQRQRTLQMLPSLRRLHLSARSNQMTTVAVEALLEMIRLRRTSTKGTLDHLILSYEYVNPWPREFIEGMKEFIHDGMKLVIEEDEVEKKYDWLRNDSAGITSIL